MVLTAGSPRNLDDPGVVRKDDVGVVATGAERGGSGGSSVLGSLRWGRMTPNDASRARAGTSTSSPGRRPVLGSAAGCSEG
jgi:hypothetical protein